MYATISFKSAVCFLKINNKFIVKEKRKINPIMEAEIVSLLHLDNGVMNNHHCNYYLQLI